MKYRQDIYYVRLFYILVGASDAVDADLSLLAEVHQWKSSQIYGVACLCSTLKVNMSIFN